ncbi:MAG: nitroreductase family deazaflavin-dependent oxidoreductase [Anaerolineae bacterium]
MAQPDTQIHPPRGWQRLLWRAPIWLYRLRLGWLLGRRFLLLNHVGRKTGLPRQAVVEVAKYDEESNTYTVASGFGKKSDWYRNLLKTPEVTIQVGLKKMAVTAVPLTPEQSGEEMVDYARRYPTAARNLTKLIGYQISGSEAEYRAIGQDVVPFVALQPRS